MAADGWIKLHRKVLEDPMWTSEPFSRGQAWVDLILLANHTPSYIRVQGMRIDVNRGDVGWSEVSLAERWKWSRGKLRRFLDELISDQMIEKKNDSKTDKRKFVITILNYNKYQDKQTSDGTSDSTSDGQATVQEQECKERKEEKDIVDDGEKISPCPHQKIISLYNKKLPALTQVKEKLWNGNRAANLSSRWKEDKERQSVEWWDNLFSQVSETPFLIGENDRGWKADLGWIVKKENMAKILEGKFSRKPKLNEWGERV